MGILSDEMQRLVDAELGFVATVCADGTPNLSPKGTTAVWDDDHLVFADVHSPGTVANLRTNPILEVNVVDPLVRRGFRFKGTASIHTDDDVFEQGIRFYEERGTVRARERIRSIVIVTVDRALPVISPAYDIGKTEEDLREQYLREYTDRAEQHRRRSTGARAPDSDAARDRYRAIAGGYDRHARVVASLRAKAVERLKLRDGAHVLDLGCGTGASFELLRAAVGDTGRVTGVDLSDEMAAVARERIARHAWENVEVVVGDAATAPLPSGLDGVLCFETHDLMRTRAVVRRAVAALRPGGRIVAFGPCAAAPRWALPINVLVRRIARRYVTTFEGFDAPWSHLAAEIPDLRVHRLFLGGAYLAIGIAGEQRTPS